MKRLYFFKQLMLCMTIVFGLQSCGGSSGSTDDSPAKINAAPTINSFIATINPVSSVEVTFSWQVSDTDNDSLSCQLDPGQGLAKITIDDCLNTTSTVVSYEKADSFNARLSVVDSSNSSSEQSIELLIVLPEPVIKSSQNQLVIFYNRQDSNYDGWILHLWNNEQCDSYADFDSNGGTTWDLGMAQTGLDPHYGAYWLIELKALADDCANFIIHKGNEKDIGGDLIADLNGNRMIWTLSSFNELFQSEILYPAGALIKGSAAHWVDIDTVFWQVDNQLSDQVNNPTVEKIRIYSSNADELAYSGSAGIIDNDMAFIEFNPNTGADHPSVALNLPRYQSLAAFTASSVDDNKVKTMLKGKLLAIAYDSDENVLAATYVQIPRVIDALYTKEEDDADEATLGLTYSASDIKVSLWAPTAKQVNLKIYNDNKALINTLTLALDENTGIWSSLLPLTYDRMYFRYELQVYHHQNLRFETLESTDPYSVSLSTNGNYSQFVNLQDNDLKPTNWDSHNIPTVKAPEDAVIIEGHIRNFSSRDQSTTLANRGKYLAFTELDSQGMKYLESLVASGLNYFHILPANDIASINEDENTRVNITDTVADLCAQQSAAPVCELEDKNATLLSVFENYQANSADAQNLAQSMRDLDSFNWGYDPKHFSTPDGSYASDPDGVSRIIEMRAMNQALHGLGLRVVLDVVYNHTNASGLWQNSVLDKVVPGYYHRRDLFSGDVFNETCCQDTAPEHVMMDKLMRDSLLIWTREYKFDGFRFDIMSNNSVDSILKARAAVQAIDSDNYFYGEGWQRSDQGYLQADQNNMAGSQVGTFNDRPRDIIRSATLFDQNSHFNDQDIMRLGLAGTLSDYQLQEKSGRIKSGKNFSQPAYAKDPADIINYVSKHDNETLWDKLQYGLSADLSVNDRVRVQNIAATMPLLSQGIVFFQLGGDLIRSKSMDRNSYDAGDWFNFVDFTKTSNNWNVGLPLAEDNQAAWDNISAIIANSETAVQSNDISFAAEVFKEFLAIRKSSPLFRLTTAQAVIDRVGFHNTGPSQSQGLLVMSIDDGKDLLDLDENYDAIVVIINGSNREQSHTIATASGFELHNLQQNSIDSRVQSASFSASTNAGTFLVPALTTAIFVKPQSNNQGLGLSAGITRDAPDVEPFGNTLVYLRGSMNNWGNDGLTSEYSFIYQDLGQYLLEVTLPKGLHTFKFADDSWSVINLGFNEVSFSVNSLEVSNEGGNLVFTADNEGVYRFIIDASNETPVITINNIAPTFDCAALSDSTDVIPFDIAGSGQLYVKGDHSGWGADEQYRLHYKGNNTYQAVADFEGDIQFKIASDDDSWQTQLWAQANSSTEINSETLAIGVTYAVSYDDAGTDNNITTLDAGRYSFLLSLNESNPKKAANVGSLIIQQCQL